MKTTDIASVEIGIRQGVPEGTCPECGAARMFDMGSSWFCSVEDAHHGGVIVLKDGRVYRADRNVGKL